MIAKIVHGKNIRVILSYNEIKVKNGEAELLLAAGYLQDHDRLSFAAKLERFQKLTRQNERTRTNAMHIILGFSAKDRLDNDLLQSIALQYMEGIGFGNQPFLLYRHYDTHHPHLHIATVNIAPGGQRIETHNIGRNQSNATRRLLEISYDLVRAEDQAAEDDILQPVRLEKVKHGKAGAKTAIGGIVSEVIDTYKFTSLPEFNAVLRQFNVMAYRGAENTLMYQKGGLVYCIVDETGEPQSIPLKASSFFFAPTLKNLEKRFEPNNKERKPLGLRLKHQLDKALQKAGSVQQLRDMLQRQGIRVLLRKNATGQVHGVTFIDNATRCVFNGSDLGKPYAAKAFIEKLELMGISLEMLAGNGNQPLTDVKEHASGLQKEKRTSNPASDQPVFEILEDGSRREDTGDKRSGLYQKRRRMLGLE